MDFSLLFVLLGAAGAVWGTLHYIITPFRVHSPSAYYFVQYVEKSKFWRFILTDEFGLEGGLHSHFSMFVRLPGTWGVHLSVGERMNQAGLESKEVICELRCFFWQRQRIKFLLTALEMARRNSEQVSVEIASAYGSTPLGFLNADIDEPYHDPKDYAAFERDVARCANGELKKTGAILYGPPGNGKTSLVRYLALKYKMPVKIVVVSSDTNDERITLLFSRLPARCIVLFEDFDSVFHNRKLMIEDEDEDEEKNSSTPVNPKSSKRALSLGAFLNGFDGIYNNYQGVVFVMTANEINKIDPALRRRPSRFRHIMSILAPSEDVRRRILGADAEAVAKSSGWSLDEILSWRDQRELPPDNCATTQTTKSTE